MPEEKEGDLGFKVVDRRPFSADGSRRPDTREEEEKKPEAPSRSSSIGANQIEAEAEEYGAEGPVGFDTLVSYLSTTAMFQLGLLAGPGGERIPPDLVNARRTLDLLEVLQQKTRGNLTPDEKRLLDDALYELRMSFVEIDKRRAKKGR